MRDWETHTWGDVATLEYGRALRDYKAKSGHVRVYGTNGPVGWTTVRQAAGPGVIVGRKGAYRGVHYSPTDFWVIDTAYYLRPRHPLHMRWAFYALTALDINSMDSGSAIPSTSRNDFYAQPVLLPPVREQARIADLLGALDDKIALNDRLAATAHQLFAAAFHSLAATGTETWRTVKLSEVCRTQYGHTASATERPIGPRFLRVTDINKRDWIDWQKVPHCEVDDATHAKYRLSVGDVLVARMADPGKAALVESTVDAVFASYLVRLTVEDLPTAVYVYGFLKSPAYSAYREARTTGSVQKNMNAKVIVGATISLPPRDSLRRFADTVWPIRQRLNAAVQESRRLAALRDALLPRLLSGELRVREAQDTVSAVT